MALADTYSTEEELSNALDSFSSWRELAKSLTKQPAPEPTATCVGCGGVYPTAELTDGDDGPICNELSCVWVCIALDGYAGFGRRDIFTREARDFVHKRSA